MSCSSGPAFFSSFLLRSSGARRLCDLHHGHDPTRCARGGLTSSQQFASRESAHVSRGPSNGWSATSSLEGGTKFGGPSFACLMSRVQLCDVIARHAPRSLRVVPPRPAPSASQSRPYDGLDAFPAI